MTPVQWHRDNLGNALDNVFESSRITGRNHVINHQGTGFVTGEALPYQSGMERISRCRFRLLNAEITTDLPLVQ